MGQTESTVMNAKKPRRKASKKTAAKTSPSSKPKNRQKAPVALNQPDPPGNGPTTTTILAMVQTAPTAPPPDPVPPRTSGYDRDLFERVLMGMNDPIEQLKTILLWRGFLARRDEAGVFLCTGSADGDVEMLQQLGVAVQRIEGHPENCAEILATHSITDEVLFRIFSHPPIYGMSGMYDFSGVVNHDWQTFLNCKYGAKVPVAVLEPGIALLVKALPLIGLHTAESCDGHLSKPTMIRFISKHHWNWAKLILPLFTDNCVDFARGWVFAPSETYGEVTRAWFLGQNGCGESLEQRFQLYTFIHRLAMNIMEDDLRARRLREGKSRLRSFEALERAADLRMLNMGEF